MRLPSLLVAASVLLCQTFAAKKPPAQRFEDFQQLSKQTSPLVLNSATYHSLTATPRNHSVAILLTALEDRFGCQLCRELQPEWELLGRSWTRGDPTGQSRHLFGTLDFAAGRDIFMALGLQTAPVLMLFPPTQGPHAVSSSEPLRYEFAGASLTADHIHAWLSRQLPDRPHPPIQRPINWLRWISTITVVIGLVTAVVSASSYILPVLQNRNIWASISLISILLFTSGHMFNHIRKVPYVAGDGQGGISYFASGFQSQYGLETQIVAAIYGVLAFCTISLAIKVPRMADVKTQQVAVIAWAVILYLIFSFLLSTFRVKNGGYPFSLPPFM